MSPDGSVNYGISGNVTAQNVAVGEGARIEVNVNARPFADELELLVRAIDQYAGPASRRQELQAAREEIVAALEAPKPEKGRILARLRAMAEAAGSASTIATAAGGLAAAVGQWL